MRAVIIVIALAGIILCHGMSMAGGAPNLTGAWQVITSEWHSEKQGFNVDKASHMKFVVTGQKRKVFWGKRTFWDQSARKMVTTPFSGVISVGCNHLFLKEHGKGTAYGDIVSDSKMYLYFMEDGNNAKILIWEVVR